MIDEISKGSVYDEVKLLRLVRLGWDMKDKLKVGTHRKFKKVKLTFVKFDWRTGLIVIRFQYNACEIETTRFDEFGLPAGVRITEFRTEEVVLLLFITK